MQMSEPTPEYHDRPTARRRHAIAALTSLLLHVILAATLFTIALSPTEFEPQAQVSASAVMLFERRVAAIRRSVRPVPPKRIVEPSSSPQPPRPVRRQRELSVPRPHASPQPPPRPVRTPRPRPAPTQAAPVERVTPAPLVAAVQPTPKVLPTNAPTPRPSPVPTRSPVPIPKPPPTQMPSPLPTRVPSPVPTVAPTTLPRVVPSPAPHPAKLAATPGPARSAAPAPQAAVTQPARAPHRPIVIAPTPAPRPTKEPSALQRRLNALIPRVHSTPSSMRRTRSVYHIGINLGPTPPQSVLALTKFLYRRDGADGKLQMWVTGVTHRGPLTICRGWLVRVPPPRYASAPGPIGGIFGSGRRPSLDRGRSGEAPIVEADVSYICSARLLTPYVAPTP